MAAFQGAWQRVIRFTGRHGDLALAAALSVAGVIEAVLERDTVSERGFPPAVLLVTVPLVWRRHWPMAVMAIAFLGAAISREAPGVEVTAAVIAAYSVGAHERRRLLGLVELLVIGCLVLAWFGGGLPPLPDVLGPFALLLPLWLVGLVVRQERLRGEAMAERAQRLEQEQHLTAQAAQAGERQRLARELHDVVAHNVSVMVVQAGAARQVVAESPDLALAALNAVEETGRQAMAELRQILGVLGGSEADFDPHPNLDRLDALVDTVRLAGLPVEVEVRGRARPLAPALELTAYRVIQEALTNALKHSGMAQTRVAIEYRASELKLEILSDGLAATGAHDHAGRGLAGMRKRIDLLGGRLEAGPGAERGYTVRAWLPMGGATS